MKIRIINDCHQFGPHQLFESSDHLFEKIVTSPYPVIGAGDNFDIKNSLLENVAVAVEHNQHARKLAQMHNARFSFPVVEPWLDGNHEIGEGTGQLFAMILGGFITHGHIPQWSKEKVDKWRKKEAGAGWLKRNFLVKPISTFRHLIPVKPSKETLDWVDYNVPQNFERIYMGHKHPPEIMIFRHSYRQIIYLPRGVNDVEV